MFSLSNRSKVFYFIATVSIFAIIVLRIALALELFKNVPLNPMDFLHVLSHVKFIATGEDYAQMYINHAEEIKFDYAPVFPGLTFFFLPFLGMNPAVMKLIVISINIVITYAVAYLVGRMMNIAVTWKVWKFSNDSLNQQLIFMLLICSRPFSSSIGPGQVAPLAALFIFISVFFRLGWPLGIATALKYSMSLTYFPLLVLIGRYKEIIKGLAIFAIFLTFPIIFHHDLWSLYHGYYAKMIDHFSHPNMDSFVGCDAGCALLLQMEWFSWTPLNLMIKGFLLILLLYGYWKNWEEERIGLNFLLLIGSVTLMLVYHREHDEMLMTVPLLMIAIHFFKEKIWIKFVFPVCTYAYFLLPGRLWWKTSSAIGHLFLGSPWVYPEVWKLFPIDSVACFILALYAFKNLWREQELWIKRS